MPRFKLVLEYDGTPFDGWQAQADGRSVQDHVERALFAFCGERLRVRAAGRTDAGVHASHQVAHADLGRDWPVGVVRDALNAHLRPQPIAVVAAERAPDGFDARLSAVKRRYRYRILDRRAPAALDRFRVWHVPRRLDVAAMQAAAATLVGRHDFTTFRASECQARSPVKTLERLHVARAGEEVVVDAEARSFLHRQVRSMVGTLALVGSGRWSVADVAAALEARERSRCGRTAPAAGLCLVGVDYPARG